MISALVLAPVLEQQLRTGIRRQDGSREAIPEQVSRALMLQLRQACERLPEDRTSVLLVHPELRRYLRRLVLRGDLELAVLSFRELAGEYNLQAVGTLELGDTSQRRSTSGASVTSLASAS